MWAKIKQVNLNPECCMTFPRHLIGGNLTLVTRHKLDKLRCKNKTHQKCSKLLAAGKNGRLADLHIEISLDSTTCTNLSMVPAGCVVCQRSRH